MTHWEKYFDQEPEDAGRHAWQDNVEPVLEANQAVLVDTDFELEDGVRLTPAPGHTPGNVIVELALAGDRVLLTGDVLHHPVQIERLIGQAISAPILSNPMKRAATSWRPPPTPAPLFCLRILPRRVRCALQATAMGLTLVRHAKKVMWHLFLRERIE